MQGGAFPSCEGDGPSGGGSGGPRCESGAIAEILESKFEPREPTPPPEPHQPSDDEEQDLIKETPAARVSAKRPRPALTRANAYAHQFAGKRPFLHREDEDDDELPDLAEYLGRFDTSVEDDIKLCRSYASYLAQSIKAVRGDAKRK